MSWALFLFFQSHFSFRLIIHTFLAYPIARRRCPSEYVVFEVTFLDGSIWKDHSPVSMLYAYFPLSCVKRSIYPSHLPKTFTIIHIILAFIDISRFPPDKCPIPVLFIFSKLAFIGIGGRIIFLASPFAYALLHAWREITFIEGTINPDILSIAFKLPKLIEAYVNISIRKELTPFPMLKTSFPFPFISVSVSVHLDAIPFRFGVSPLAYVGIALGA